MKYFKISLLLFLISTISMAQDIESLQKAGETLMNGGNNQEALAKFKEAIALDTSSEGNSILYAYAGLCAENIDNTAEAKTFFRSAIERGFEEDIIYIKLGEIYKKEKDYKGQEFVYQKGMLTFPQKEFDFGKKLAYTYYNSKQYKKLEPLTKQLLTLKPNDPKMMQFNATALQGQKKMAEAKAMYEKLYDVDPENLSANIFLGNYAYQVGKSKIDQETKRYEAIKTPDRMQWSNYQKKMKILIDEGYGKALPYLEKANELKPGDKNIGKMLYAIYMKTGNREKAAAFAPAQ